jgi:hypothetical protein
MDGCSKLYCKSDNLLKIGIKDRKYFLELDLEIKKYVSLSTLSTPPNASARQVCR